MPRVSPDDYYIEYSFETCVGHSDSSGIDHITARINYQREDDSEELAGKASFYRVIDVDSCYSVLELLDMDSDTAHFMSLIDTDEPGYISSVRGLLDYEPFNFDMLILNRLELRGPHRGSMIGRHIIRRTVIQLGMGVGLVALLPFPLQCRGDGNWSKWQLELGYDKMSQDTDASRKKLVAIYSECGFRAVPGDDVMVANPEQVIDATEALEVEG